MKIDAGAVMRTVYGKGRGLFVDELQVSPETWRITRVISLTCFVVAFLMYAAASSFGQGLPLIGAMGAMSILGIVGSGVVYCLPAKTQNIQRGRTAIAVGMICSAISLLLGLAAGYLVF